MPSIRDLRPDSNRLRGRWSTRCVHGLDGPAGFAEAEGDPGPVAQPIVARDSHARPATWLLAVTTAAGTMIPGFVLAQEKGDIRELKLRDWQPRSMLVTKVTEVAQAGLPGHRRAQSSRRRQGSRSRPSG